MCNASQLTQLTPSMGGVQHTCPAPVSRTLLTSTQHSAEWRSTARQSPPVARDALHLPQLPLLVLPLLILLIISVDILHPLGPGLHHISGAGELNRLLRAWKGGSLSAALPLGCSQPPARLCCTAARLCSVPWQSRRRAHKATIQYYSAATACPAPPCLHAGCNGRLLLHALLHNGQRLLLHGAAGAVWQRLPRPHRLRVQGWPAGGNAPPGWPACRAVAGYGGLPLTGHPPRPAPPHPATLRSSSRCFCLAASSSSSFSSSSRSWMVCGQAGGRAQQAPRLLAASTPNPTQAALLSTEAGGTNSSAWAAATPTASARLLPALMPPRPPLGQSWAQTPAS